MNASWLLSTAERRAYNAEGYFVRPGVFTGGEVATLIELMSEVIRQAATASGTTYHLDGNRFVDDGFATVQFEHQPGSQTVRVVEPAHRYQPCLLTWLADPRLTTPMTELVGAAQIALWTEKLNCKAPEIGSGFGWHQDSPYWVHDSDHVDQLPNVFVALDASGPEQGGLEVIPKSHLSGCLPGTDNGTQLGGFFTDPGSFEAETAVCPRLSPGDCLFFSPHIVHGSAPNTTSVSRRAWIATYQPAGYAALKSGTVQNLAHGVDSPT